MNKTLMMTVRFASHGHEGEKWIWDFSVPDGATASVTLPGEAMPRAYPAGNHHVERRFIP